MNLLGTLAKVAVGVMLARGAGRMMRGGGGASGGGGAAGRSAGGGLGDLIGGLGGGGGAGDLLGGLLGSLAGGLAGGRAQGPGGGLGDLLGSVLSGGGSSGSGGLGDLLDSLGGGQRGSGGFGQMFNRAMAGDVTEPSAEVHRDAGILLQAMINAAKSDGAVDPDEQRQILEHLSDVGADERDFVRQELSRPADLDGFLRSIPQQLGPQVYLMSLLAIKLDSNAEVRYLDRLAQATGLTPESVNEIHAQVGVPPLYR